MNIKTVFNRNMTTKKKNAIQMKINMLNSLFVVSRKDTIKNKEFGNYNDEDKIRDIQYKVPEKKETQKNIESGLKVKSKVIYIKKKQINNPVNNEVNKQVKKKNVTMHIIRPNKLRKLYQKSK